MSTPSEIPLTPAAQQFAITINGVTYNLVVQWNRQNQTWMLDINDTNNNPIVQGIPFVTGADLLAQYEYLNFGFQLFAQTDNNIYAPPTYQNLGTTGHLYVVTP